MTTNFTDTLDLALGRLQAGEPVSSILADYPADAAALQPFLETAASLQSLLPVETPPEAALQADRAQFLAMVENFPTQAVSPGILIRLKEQITNIFSQLSLPYQWTGERRMGTLLIKAVIVVGLLFGSMGGTAAMAVNSLPNSPVYPVKLLMEQARLALANTPDEQAELHLMLAQTRIQEMVQLAQTGKIPNKITLNRAQSHLDQALRLTAQLPEDALSLRLLQAQQVIQLQIQQLDQIQMSIEASPAEEILQQTSQYLSQVQQEVDMGLQDPQSFQIRFGNAQPQITPVQPSPTVTPTQIPPLPNNQHKDDQADDRVTPGQRNKDCPNAGDCEPAGSEHQSRTGDVFIPDQGRADNTTQHQNGQQDQEEMMAPGGQDNDQGRADNTTQHQNGQQDQEEMMAPGGQDNDQGYEDNTTQHQNGQQDQEEMMAPGGQDNDQGYEDNTTQHQNGQSVDQPQNTPESPTNHQEQEQGETGPAQTNPPEVSQPAPPPSPPVDSGQMEKDSSEHDNTSGGHSDGDAKKGKMR